jgi:hypothetical protein
VLALALGAVGVAATGCTGGARGDGQPSPTPSTTGSADLQAAEARGQLAGLVAAALDRHYAASYTQKAKGRAAGTLRVSLLGADAWQVVVAGGALGGTVDVALTRTPAGLYQCPLQPTPSCLSAGSALPGRSDPRFQHIFTDWLSVLRDPRSAISVDSAQPPAGARGRCFSVEPNVAALAAPLDAGVYCFDPDGTLTAATIAAGTLILVGAALPAPASITLPGPVVPGAPLGTAAPPTPPPTTAPASPTASASSSRKP